MWGSPELGWAASGVPCAVPIRRRMSSRPCGPRVQLVPTAASPRSRSRARTSPGASPATVSGAPSSSTKVAWATTGRSVTSRTTSTAASRSVPRAKVSSSTRSTPPSTSASTCSRIAAAAVRIVERPTAAGWGRRGDRAGHPHRAVGGVPDGRGQTGAREVDLADPARQAVAFETQTRRPVGVGLQDVGAGGQVAPVQGGDELRRDDAQLDARAVRAHAAGLGEGAHRAVDEQHPPGEGPCEGLVHSSISPRISSATWAASRSR